MSGDIPPPSSRGALCSATDNTVSQDVDREGLARGCGAGCAGCGQPELFANGDPDGESRPPAPRWTWTWT